MRPTLRYLIIVTKLVLGFVSSAGTARGVKQLIFPGVDFSPYGLYATLYIQEKHVMHTGFA